MSDARKPRGLDAIVAEARTHLAPRPRDVDWSAVERGLEARLAAEERSPRVAHLRAPSPAGRLIALGLAAAAAALLVVGRDRDAAPLGGSALVAADATGSAGTLKATEPSGTGDTGGGGEVRVAGALVETGLGLRTGDVIEVAGARAVFERPRRVTWLLEGDGGPGRGRGRVTTAGDLIVLALDEGAIEAQVSKSDAPETFAVDVAAGGRTVRVAVHGTHLRVARAGARLVVDLTEGVVSIGVPPRSGPTYGMLVTAPAHVELDVADPNATPRVDHDRKAVRAAIPLGSELGPATAQRDVPGALDRNDRAARAGASPGAGAGAGGSSSPGAQLGVVERPSRKPDSPTASGAQSPTTFVAAVRACVVSARKARPEVSVTVSSVLRLRVSNGGEVQSAVFDPPLPPEVQTCAASKIYGPRLDVTGPVDVPIQLSY
jgi:hypothetical protein